MQLHLGAAVRRVEGVAVVDNKIHLETLVEDLRNCSVFDAKEKAFRVLEVVTAHIKNLQSRVVELERKING